MQPLPASEAPDLTTQSHAALASAWQIVAAQFRLVQFCDRNSRRWFGMRASKLAAICLTVGCAAALLGVARRSPETAEALVIRGADWLTWVVGAGVCWSAAGDFTRRYESSGLLALAATRGFARAEVQRAHTLAAGLRAFRLAALPSLALGTLTLALATNVPELLRRTALLGALLVHGVFLGVLVHALLRLVGAATERTARLTLAFAWLAPEVAQAIWPTVPSISALLRWMIEGLHSVVST